MDQEQISTSPVCYRHPGVQTRLHCSNCERPICVDCSQDAAVGQKCPECTAPQGRHRVIHAGRELRAGPSFATSPVTFSIIGIAAALFVLGATSPTIESWLFNNLEVDFFIGEGEVWRLITAAFVHGDLFHIGFNMYALYLFGPRLEREIGSMAFASLYVASAAAGSATSFIFGPEFGRSVGASGAIFGLFGAWLFVAYKMRTSPAGRAMFNQLVLLLGINLAFPFFVARIDWRAHIGGLVAGVVIAYIWSKLAVGKRNAKLIRTASAGAVFVAALVASQLF